MTSESSTPPSLSGGSEILLKALRKVLAPLVRMMLAHGIGYRQAAGLLKQVYVDVANQELLNSGGDPSTSRLSLFTGIHRKEIKRLLGNPPDRLEVPQSIALGAQAIGRWTGDARFTNEDGRPRPLLRSNPDEAHPGFDQLIISVTTDVHPRSVLDEWLRLGIVELDDQERIHLVTAAFVPKKGFDEKAFYFERNLHDHLDVATRNLSGEEPALLERSVSYARLKRSTIAALEDFARREGMRLLEEINLRALRSQEATSNEPDEAGEALERMNFGLYFCREAGHAPVPNDAPSEPAASRKTSE